MQEGRPEGRSDSHWQEAVALYEAEGAQSKDARAKPPAEPAAEKPVRSGAKKTAEATAGKKTTAEPNAQKPSGAGKPKPAEPAGKPAEKPATICLGGPSRPKTRQQIPTQLATGPGAH